MSFLLISVDVPNSTLALGMGTMVGLLFPEKAYLKLCWVCVLKSVGLSACSHSVDILTMSTMQYIFTLIIIVHEWDQSSAINRRSFQQRQHRDVWMNTVGQWLAAEVTDAGTCGTAWQSCSRTECSGSACRSCRRRTPNLRDGEAHTGSGKSQDLSLTVSV